MCLCAQDGQAAAVQQCEQIGAEVKTLKENAALDFERIGLLSEENTSLQVLTCTVNLREVALGSALWGGSHRIAQLRAHRQS